MSEGYAKAKAIADKLKVETEEKEEQHEVAKTKAISQLMQIRDNSELAQMYQESSKLGAENLGGELPLLKVHATGRSSSELADGTEPTDGAFFYKPNKETFESVNCHILTISRGFKAKGLENNGGEVKEVFNQLLGGVIVDGTDYKPFIMYFTGLKLQNLWAFGKEASRYTRAKPVSIPMFALMVKLTTEKISNNFGKSWVVNFEIQRTDDGQPQLVLDPGEFQMLKDMVGVIEETIHSVIEAKTTHEESEDAVITGAVPVASPIEEEPDREYAG